MRDFLKVKPGDVVQETDKYLDPETYLVIAVQKYRGKNRIVLFNPLRGRSEVWSGDYFTSSDLKIIASSDSP